MCVCLRVNEVRVVCGFIAIVDCECLSLCEPLAYLCAQVVFDLMNAAMGTLIDGAQEKATRAQQ